jgi:hypothetical protein
MRSSPLLLYNDPLLTMFSPHAQRARNVSFIYFSLETPKFFCSAAEIQISVRKTIKLLCFNDLHSFLVFPFQGLYLLFHTCVSFSNQNFQSQIICSHNPKQRYPHSNTHKTSYRVTKHKPRDRRERGYKSDSRRSSYLAVRPTSYPVSKRP